MNQIQQSIHVNAPLSTVYNQWTQCEEFPRFMEGVREVRQIDNAHLHWRAMRHGCEVEWNSEIIDQVPDELIAWRDVDGPDVLKCHFARIAAERREISSQTQRRRRKGLLPQTRTPCLHGADVPAGALARR